MATQLAWEGLRVERTRDDQLLTGDEYRASLRDNRRVIDANGEEVDDVTNSPQLRPGIDSIAEYYDAHFQPETRSLLTYTDPDTGRLASAVWKVPETLEDLAWKREVNRFSTYQLMGVFGRPPDYSSCNALGLLTVAPELASMDASWAKNVDRYLEWGRRNGALQADITADVQSDRRVPVAEKPGRLRCVEERSDGLILYGAKPCSSVSAQAHVGGIRTTVTPHANPDAALFCAVPIDSPGLTMVLREPVTQPSNEEDHPLDSRGEEIDTFMIFDHVFVPHEQVFAYRRPEFLRAYHEVGSLCLWHVLVRLAHKAELLAGTAQLIANVLGTTSIPQVRDTISGVTEYATTLMAFVIASEREATLQNGVMVPSERYVTAGRLHSIVNYPKVLQSLKELSGQGLISRFTRAQLDRDDIGQLMEEFVPGTGCSARAKNRLFNFVWDLTCGSNANRVALFEGVNSQPPSAMRARMYDAKYREPWTEYVQKRLGIELDSPVAR